MPERRLRTCAAALAVAAVLSVCATAEAKIVLGKSIHGVKLGMTRAQVQQILGTGSDIGGGLVDWYNANHKLAYRVEFGSGVDEIFTYVNKDRTSRGLGVGTKLTKLQRQRGMNCLRSAGGSGPIRECVVGSTKSGHRYTDFMLGQRNRVNQVLVAYGTD